MAHAPQIHIQCPSWQTHVLIYHGGGLILQTLEQSREHIRQIMWIIIGNNVQIDGVEPNYEIMLLFSPAHRPCSLFEVMRGRTGVSNTSALHFPTMVQIWYFMAEAVQMIGSDRAEPFRRHACNGCWLAPTESPCACANRGNHGAALEWSLNAACFPPFFSSELPVITRGISLSLQTGAIFMYNSSAVGTRAWLSGRLINRNSRRETFVFFWTFFSHSFDFMMDRLRQLLKPAPVMWTRAHVWVL